MPKLSTAVPKYFAVIPSSPAMALNSGSSCDCTPQRIMNFPNVPIEKLSTTAHNGRPLQSSSHSSCSWLS